MIRTFLVVLIALSLGCAMTPKNTKQLAAQSPIHIKGLLAGPPELDDDKRLFIYLRVDEKIITAVAVNEKRKEILRYLNQRILTAPSDKPIFIYGTKVKGRWEEFTEGVDYEITAIGVYASSKQGYFIILTGFGNNWKDYIDVKNLGKRIIKEGFSLVRP